MRWRRLNLEHWLQGFFLILLLVYVSVWVGQIPQSGKMVDFLATYTAGRMVIGGNGHNLYNLDEQRQTQQPIAHINLPPDDLLPYVTPPFFIVPFLPLFFLSFYGAFAGMVVINVLLTLFILSLLKNSLPGLSLIGWGTMLLATFSFFPWFVNLMQGQNAMLTLLILSGVFLLLKHRRDGWAGAVLALGLFKPQLNIIFFAVLVAKRRWRAVLAYIGVALALLAISYALVGRTGIEDYIKLTLIDSPLVDGFYGIKYPKMHNWRGFFTVMAGRNRADLAAILTLGASAVSVAVLGWNWRGVWQPDEPRFDFQFAFSVVVTLLVSPHLNTHDLTLWLLVAALIVNGAIVGELHDMTRQKMAAVFVVGSLVSLLTFPLSGILHMQLTTLFMVLIGGLALAAIPILTQQP